MNRGHIASKPNYEPHRPNVGCLGLGQTEGRLTGDDGRMDGLVELESHEYLTKPDTILGTLH